MEAEAYGTGQTVVLYRQTVLIEAVRSHVPTPPSARQAERQLEVGSCRLGGMFMFDWRAPMTPQKATLDSMRTLSCFVSYRRI